MRTASFLALALGLLGSAAFFQRVKSQEPPKGEKAKPAAVYGQFRALIAEGKYDIAVNYLQAFLDSNPTDADFLEIEKKYGTTAFSTLRTIPRWSEDPAVEKTARANVEEAIKRAKAATAKLLQDPARVAKYIRNLGATYEERVFAAEELRRTGDYAIPPMVEVLRITPPKDPIYQGILAAIPVLEPQTMAGWVAALDGFTPEQQFGVLNAIASRPDVLVLQNTAQTDLAPRIWYILSQPADQNSNLRLFAEKLLNALRPGTKAETKLPEAELVAIARTFYEHKALYAGAKKNPDGSTVVPLWLWDATDAVNPKLVKVEDVPTGQADEYYGLRYARWAFERKTDYEPAQGLILAIAGERAIERAKFGSLARTEPAVFKLLSDAPSSVLGDLLNRGMNQKKTALVLAMLQVLGDRGDRDAALPPPGVPARPPLFVRALTYPDPQVQFTAANALLRSPVPVPPAVRGQIVDILRRAAAADPGSPDNAKGVSLIADPNKIRGDLTALLFRGLGYDVEVVTSGRDLFRRVARASDFDVIFIDYHIANPDLIDIIGQLQGNLKTGNRPTFVVASPDKPRVPTFDQLLVRFAALIAATENDLVDMPPPFVPNPALRLNPQELADLPRTTAQKRDGVFLSTAASRIARLNRAIDSTGLPATLSPAQKLLLELRVELITYAILGVEFPITPASAPDTDARLDRLRKQLALQPPTPPYGAGVPTTDLLKLMERFETDLARVPVARKRFEDLYSKVDPVELGLPVETFRDLTLETRLRKSLGNYPAVRIISEPFTRAELAADLNAVQSEPGQAPRDPAEKKAAQRVSIEWLRKMATGEITGFDVKPAEVELRDALRIDDLADDAIDAVVRFPGADAQQSLLLIALNAGKPLPLRIKAADATIHHIQVNGKLIPKTVIDALVEQSDKEADLTLRGKLETLKGLLAFTPADFVNQLKGYNPPLLPAVPKEAEPKKDAEPKKE